MNNFRKSRLEHYNDAFSEAKQTLNEKQKLAVDHIYGPVMTVAGPGTGKTQLLAVRIGNILQQTDVNIGNILSLTFTDAGSIAMRERLKRFIGPEAYNAPIFTFHSFCSYVIQENIQYFGGFRNLQIVSDLELVDVYREIIDGFDDDNPLKRFKGNIYYEQGRMKNLFNTMKQEGWTPEYIKQKVEELTEYHTATDEAGEYIHTEFLVKGKQTGKQTGTVYTKGQINMDKVQEQIDKKDTLIAAAYAIEEYNAILKRIERYDYHDMILWVIDAFKSNDELLAKYQERYQFLLVDEYQDTNGAQNELLFLLADNPIDDKPNVFIVGDDDQSIFRFQGANMNNIIDFADKYNPIEVVLDNNYRSYQGILDWSKELIENNGERLVNLRSHLTKELIESKSNAEGVTSQPQVYRFKNTPQLEIGIIKDIIEKNKNGVEYKDIAIIYRGHKEAGNLVKYLMLHNIPINIKKRVDVLKQGEVKRLIMILKYIMAEYKKPMSGEEYIFEIMHYDYFRITAKDIARLSIYCSNRTDEVEDDRSWRMVIGNKDSITAAGVEDVDSVLHFSTIIEEWIQAIPNATAQILFEKILTRGKILEYILASEDKAWKLQLVNTFFNFIKDESSKVENISMPDILEKVRKMEENEIELPLNRIIFSENGINFMTAHGSKGLEFDHVYIINADEKTWVKKNANNMWNYSLPKTLTPISETSDVEDDRRLMYVAMTRARNELTIAYSDYNDSEKALEPVRFISEITAKEDDITSVDISDEEVLEYKATLLRYHQGQAQLIEHDLIDNVLQSFKVSATSLNKYLRCPLAFYFENILRVPMARGASNGFGNAIHYALELYFHDLEADAERKILPEEVLQSYFLKGMKKYHSHFTEKERELSITRGKKLISEYFAEYHTQWNIPRKNELEFDIKTEYKGVPISGKLDRVAIYDDHLEVIDYKTGKYDSKKLKGPTSPEDNGGDYWRQIVFYRLLLMGDDRLSVPMRKGVMDFVEKEKDKKFNRKPFTVEDFEVEIVGEQLANTYKAIQNHEFENGCQEEDCNWCNFVNENMTLELPIVEDDEEEENRR